LTGRISASCKGNSLLPPSNVALLIDFQGDNYIRLTSKTVYSGFFGLCMFRTSRVQFLSCTNFSPWFSLQGNNHILHSSWDYLSLISPHIISPQEQASGLSLTFHKERNISPCKVAKITS
jgi:hypothetical protein